MTGDLVRFVPRFREPQCAGTERRDRERTSAGGLLRAKFCASAGRKKRVAVAPRGKANALSSSPERGKQKICLYGKKLSILPERMSGPLQSPGAFQEIWRTSRNTIKYQTNVVKADLSVPYGKEEGELHQFAPSLRE